MKENSLYKVSQNLLNSHKLLSIETFKSLIDKSKKESSGLDKVYSNINNWLA